MRTLDRRSLLTCRCYCAESAPTPRSTGASVAERELTAALGARRALVGLLEPQPVPLLAAPPPLFSTVRPPTFPPAAVPPDTNKQWNDFIAANHSPRLQPSILYVTLLALINRSLRYEYSNISVNYPPLRYHPTIVTHRLESITNKLCKRVKFSSHLAKSFIALCIIDHRYRKISLCCGKT